MDDNKEIEGTVRDLFKLRQALRSTNETIVSLHAAGMDTTTLGVTQESLASTVVLVPVPCLVCRKTYRQPAAVAGDGLPYAVLCGDCNDKIEAEVAALDKPRRKRRTKAEMEAHRLATEGGPSVTELHAPS